MLVKIVIRRRGILDEDSTVLSEQHAASLCGIHGFWHGERAPTDAVFNTDGESARLDLDNFLVGGITGYISYAGRFVELISRDVAMADDWISLSVDTKRVDYKAFIFDTLPNIILAFRPYRAAVYTDKSAIQTDFEAICAMAQSTGQDVDGRDGVFRVWPVFFFDKVLCQRSFGLDIDQVVKRINDVCERVDVFAEGVFAIVNSKLVAGPDLDLLNTRLLSRLGSVDLQVDCSEHHP